MTDQGSAAIKRTNPSGLRRWWRFAGDGSFSSPARRRLIGTAKLSVRPISQSRQRRCSKNWPLLWQSVGCTVANLIKLTVFLRSMDNLSAYREARNRFFATVTPAAAPAVTLVEVSRLYGPDILIEIEAVAAG